MKKSDLFRLALLVAMMLSIALTACKKDDPSPDNGTPVKPDTEISDPEGTITLSMRNTDSGNTRLDGQIYIENENFGGGYFVSIGPVKGLGNVSSIPLKGWSEQVAVVPGCGYVAYNPSNATFYRIYVVQEVGSTTGGVIGAEIKYQKPFKGVDEALKLSSTSVTIPGYGDQEEVTLTNTSFIDFTATSNANWCRVNKEASGEFAFLYDRVTITCEENPTSTKRTATVSLNTSYGKSTTISVTQNGAEAVVVNKKTFKANGVEFTMIEVPGGTFTMGATSEQGSVAYADESPTHSVTLSSYWIGQTEVTQELWAAVMGSNPSYFKGDSRPVETVSWEDCQEFIAKLNVLTGEKFRLPTEAEWEYAARGGKLGVTMYAGSNDISSVAWYSDNSSNQTQQVGTKAANRLGIYDMSGNVWEWCQDWYGSYDAAAQTNPQGPAYGSSRVNRGGSWYFDARSCRVSNRHFAAPSLRDYFSVGLRLARSSQ